jgi:hypothetical protein
MIPEIEYLKTALTDSHTIYLINTIDEVKHYLTEAKAIEFAKTHLDLNSGVAHLNLLDQQIYFVLSPMGLNSMGAQLEYLRKKGYDISKNLAYYKVKAVQIVTTTGDTKPILALTEGLALSNYQFLKYKTDKTSKSLHSITITGPSLTASHAEELTTIIEAVYKTRDLINEPVIYLTAEQLSAEINDLGDAYGFSVEVLDKKEIIDLKMGGLLGVNIGSPNPPTFNVLEYRHPKSANAQPVVLIGKGVVYDTGGLSLKPTLGSMDSMKCDMAGAAAVIAMSLLDSMVRWVDDIFGGTQRPPTDSERLTELINQLFERVQALEQKTQYMYVSGAKTGFLSTVVLNNGSSDRITFNTNGTSDFYGNMNIQSSQTVSGTINCGKIDFITNINDMYIGKSGTFVQNINILVIPI